MSVELVQQLTTPEGLDNPYPIYRALREQNAVLWVPSVGNDNEAFWFVTRYDLVENILKDQRVWKDSTRLGYQDQSLFSKSMLFQDPPDHTRLRSLVNRAFTPSMVRQLAPRIEEIVNWLVDRIAEEQVVDFMPAFAMPLPVIVIAEILGIPAQDRDRFRAWSRQLIAATDLSLADEQEAQAGMQATRFIGEYFDQLIRERRQKPGDDLLSALIELEEAGDRLSHQELLGMCLLLLIAGHETTMNLLGNGFYALMQHPGQLDRLRNDSGLIETAVEEMLRYDAPVQQGTYRFAGESFSMEGASIEPGQTVVAVLGAANHDPAYFSRPDEFDVGRKPNRHLAFGRGIHFCLGAPVARLEAQIAWSTLLARFQTMELVSTPQRRSNTVFRGFDTLTARFTA